MNGLPSSPLTWSWKEWFDRLYHRKPLYTYQLEWLWAMEQAVWQALLDGVTEELVGCWARQAGKNETDAAWTIRALLYFGPRVMAGHFPRIDEFKAVKSAPTRDPQITVSWMRLVAHIAKLTGVLFPQDEWQTMRGYIMRLRSFPALIAFLSAQERASRRGWTANAWMTVDECQHTSLEVWENDLSPMRSTTAAPAFFQGTMWDDQSLIALKIDELRGLEKKDGRKRVFFVPWDAVAEHNPTYGSFVEREAGRLGWDHPKMLSEYLLKSPGRLGDMFSAVDLVRLHGQHSPRTEPQDGRVYVAGVDFCGADEQPTTKAFDPSWTDFHDNTCLVIAELGWKTQVTEKGLKLYIPAYKTVFIHYWPGIKPEALVDEIERIAFYQFHCIIMGADGNGVGNGPAHSLEARWTSDVVKVYNSSETDNDRQGNRLAGAVKTGRFELYHEPEPGKPLELIRKEFKYLKRETKPGGKMRWGHPPRKIVVDGVKVNMHDDGPKACGLLVDAGYEHMAARFPNQVRDQDYKPYDETAWLAEGRAA